MQSGNFTHDGLRPAQTDRRFSNDKSAHHLRLGLSSLLMVPFLALLQTASAFAGRPLVTDDAFPVPSGQVQIEFGMSYNRPAGGGRELTWPVASIAYGLIKRLETSLSIQRVDNADRGEMPVAGFQDIHLGAKLIFVEEIAGWPAMSLALDIKLPTANESKGLSTGKSDQGFTLIFSKDLAPIELDLNLGYLRVGSAKNEKLKNVISGGIAAQYALRPEVVLVGEIFGASRSDQGSPNQAAFQLGLRYAATPQLVLDTAAGRSLRPTGSDFQITAGLTWTHDFATLISKPDKK